MDCEQVKYDIAAEALTGQNESGDSAARAAHLEECPSCRQEREQLRGVARLLSNVARHEVEGVPIPHPGRALVAARRELPWPPATTALVPSTTAPRRPTAGAATGLQACAALAVAFAAGWLAHGGGLAGRAGDAEPERRAGVLRRIRATDAVTGADADVGMCARGWGTEISLRLGGVRGPGRCALVVISASGRREVVAHWRVPPQGYGVSGAPDRLKVVSSSSLTQGEIAALEIETSQGGMLMRITA